jgi:hypothetical protein
MTKERALGRAMRFRRLRSEHAKGRTTCMDLAGLLKSSPHESVYLCKQTMTLRTKLEKGQTAAACRLRAFVKSVVPAWRTT